MCKGGAKKLLNPNPKQQIQNINDSLVGPGVTHELQKLGGRAAKASGNPSARAYIDPLNGKAAVTKDAKASALADANYAQTQADSAAAGARASEADSYNANVINSKRRRRAGSLLSQSGSGVTGSSALAQGSTYGKTSLGQ
jgi:hypothetical protein